MSLQGWQPLSCECGNKFFQQAHTLAWHESQGTSLQPAGYTCTGCGKRSDTAKMINVAKQRNLQSKMDELKEQMA